MVEAFLAWIVKDVHPRYGRDQPFVLPADRAYWETRYADEWLREMTTHNLDNEPLSMHERDIRVRNRVLLEYRIYGVRGSRPLPPVRVDRESGPAEGT
jgi:hypothetical protein